MSGKGNPRRTNGWRRNQIRKRLKATGGVCAFCHRPIDYDAPYMLDGHVNPWCFVVDEILPVSRGGSPYDLANCQPAHHICNAIAGDKSKTLVWDDGTRPRQESGKDSEPREIARSVEL